MGANSWEIRQVRKIWNIFKSMGWKKNQFRILCPVKMSVRNKGKINKDFFLDVQMQKEIVISRGTLQKRWKKILWAEENDSSRKSGIKGQWAWEAVGIYVGECISFHYFNHSKKITECLSKKNNKVVWCL